MSNFRVLLLDTKQSNPNHYLCLAVRDALQESRHVESVFLANLGNAIPGAIENKCNLFIAFDGEELHPEICKRLKSICGFSVAWITEDPYELSVNLANEYLFDLICTTDSLSVSAYGIKGFHLPLAAWESIQFHSVCPDEQSRYDLFFAGTAWPNRVEFINKITNEIDGLSSKIALSSNPHIPKVNIDFPLSAYSWRTPNNQFARIANKSRITLGLYRDYSTSQTLNTSATTPGPRIFEVAMAGSFQLVDGSLPEIGKYFEIGREISIFSDANDCIDKINYYLNHPEERLKIAVASQNRALSHHTYFNRLEALLSEVRSRSEVLPLTLSFGSAKKPRVLIVSHNVLGQNSWGGVEVYQEWIFNTLSEFYEIWFYYPIASSVGLKCRLEDGGRNEVAIFEFSKTLSDNDLLTCKERENSFSSILIDYQISVVHFQHLIGHIPSLPLIARALGIPTIYSMHDYYSLCEHFNLVGEAGNYCGVETRGEIDCDNCLSKTLNLAPGSQARRRSFFRRILKSFDVLHANTIGVKERIQSVYGELQVGDRWEIMPVPIKELPKSDRSSDQTSLRVIIFGNFTKYKGGDLLLNVLKALKDSSIIFTVLGRVDPEYVNCLNQLPYVKIMGGYHSWDLPEILEEFDVSIHASIWPETYCITLSEAWRAGLVPVVSDIGALGERVRDGDNGFKFPVDKPGKVVEILHYLSLDRQSLKRISANDLGGELVFDLQHLTWLQGLYKKLLEGSVAGDQGISGHPISLSDCGILLNDDFWRLGYEKC